ncbi:MAG: HD-GYP domain-containing protein, partial [Wenzhouxiangella sp.]
MEVQTLSLSQYRAHFRSTRALTAALHERDEHTRHHCDRVVLLAEAMGRALGLNGSDMAVLRLAGRFHDVGKIGIPDAILLKESR